MLTIPTRSARYLTPYLIEKVRTRISVTPPPFSGTKIKLLSSRFTVSRNPPRKYALFIFLIILTESVFLSIYLSFFLPLCLFIYLSMSLTYTEYILCFLVHVYIYVFVVKVITLITTSTGASIIRMMNHFLTEATLRSGLSDYLNAL